MVKKIISLLLIVGLMGFVMAGCTSDNENPNGGPQDGEITQYPLTITDSTGQELTFDKKPERLITVAPSITETIFALGQEEFLVGRTDFCDYPNAVSNIQAIGTLRNPNIEKIIELEPDLVIASTHFSEEVFNNLNNLGIKVIVLNPQDSFEGVYEVITKLGQILDVNEVAQELVDDMKAMVEEVKDKVKDQEKPRVYYVVGFGEFGDWTAGGGTFINEMIEMAAGINVASDVEGWSYSLEKLVEHDPDLLIVSNKGDVKEAIAVANGYDELTAIKEGRIFEIDNNLLDRQGPRLAQGLKELAKILHPDVF